MTDLQRQSLEMAISVPVVVFIFSWFREKLHKIDSKKTMIAKLSNLEGK